MAPKKLQVDGRLYEDGKPETRFLRKLYLVLASRYAPGTVRAIGEKAARGDLEAARLLCDFVFQDVQMPPE